MDEIMQKCDIVIATSGVSGLIEPHMIKKGQIIFALSNPNPEITPVQPLIPVAPPPIATPPQPVAPPQPTPVVANDPIPAENNVDELLAADTPDVSGIEDLLDGLDI